MTIEAEDTAGVFVRALAEKLSRRPTAEDIRKLAAWYGALGTVLEAEAKREEARGARRIVPAASIP